MPVYLYKCEKDELIFEREYDEPQPRAICPECGRFCPRKYQAPKVHYKGDGFTGAQREERENSRTT